MRSWEQMKDLSYVGIKVTKAKSLSEGLAKCKEQKLTRQNPLYEHIKLHKLLKRGKRCNLCSNALMEPTKQPTQFEQQVQNAKMDVILPQKRSATEPLRKIVIPINRKISQSISNKSPRRIPSPKRQAKPLTSFEQATQRFSNLKKIINNFNNRLNKTRSCFFKMQKNSQRLNSYFMTEVDQIEHQIDQDKTLSVAEVKSNRMHLEQEYEKFKQWEKAVSKKVKEMNQPVIFPLNQAQMKRVIQNAKLKNNNPLANLNKMVRSIYAYKSSMNFQNKMKIINNQSKK